jgi:RNA-directed DNA polymerase
MNDRGRSDGLVVAARLSNDTGLPVAEAVGGRGPAEGNAAGKTRAGRSAGHDASGALDRVRRRAIGDKEARFSALLHHVDADRPGAAYRALSPRAATGTDGVTWETYRRDLEGNLRDLLGRVHRGGYRARPARRAWIPKSDGRQRPLGIAARRAAGAMAAAGRRWLRGEVRRRCGHGVPRHVATNINCGIEEGHGVPRRRA